MHKLSFIRLFVLLFSMLPALLLAQSAQTAKPFGPRPVCMLKGLAQELPTRVGPPQFLGSRAQSAHFDISYTGILTNVPQEAKDAFQYAADIWGMLLASPETIRVDVRFLNFAGVSFLGLSLPNGVKDFPGAPLPQTWYPSALADAITRTDQQPGQFDMSIYMRGDFSSWYTGLDGQVPSGQYDLVSVALHELGHGLGVASIGSIEGNIGGFGLLDSTDFLVGVGFPFPKLDTLPGAYDRFMWDQASGWRVTDTLLFPNPSTTLFNRFTSGQLYFDGPLATAALGQRPKIYAPAVWDQGSSITHLDESTFPAGDTNSLMSPFIGQREVTHSPGPVVIGLLQDIGWPMPGQVAIEPPAPELQVYTFPNPSSGTVHIHYLLHEPADILLRVFDIKGKEVWQEQRNALPGDQLHTWPGGASPGMYFYRLESDRGHFSGKVIIR